LVHKPLVVHNDRSIYLLEWMDQTGSIAQELTEFADFIKAPEEVHTYKLSPYALWSAAAKGLKIQEIFSTLERYSCNTIEATLKAQISKNVTDFGTLELLKKDGLLELKAKNKDIVDTVCATKQINPNIIDRPGELTLRFNLNYRIELKRELYKKDLFVIDHANLIGEPFDINIRKMTRSGEQLNFRDYQIKAAQEYLRNKNSAGGGGSIIMPPFSGKSLVGIKIIEALKTHTLIIVENEASLKRWSDELDDKTDVAEDCIACYTSTNQEIKPITISTYSFLASNQIAMGKLTQINWGLAIYDDAHKLPAETYLQTVDIPSQYKLAMASTLARYDGNGNLVLALVGPKWFEIVPKALEAMGYQVPITCVEVMVPLSEKDSEKYNSETKVHLRRTIAQFNDNKEMAIETLFKRDFDKNMVFVSYRKELAKRIAMKLRVPLVSSATYEDSYKIRDSFNEGKLTRIATTSIVEKVDLRGIDILVAFSYHGESEREEYLRIGKLMDATGGRVRSYFIALVSKNTIEESDYSSRRSRLINYGYRFRIVELEELGELELVE